MPRKRLVGRCPALFLLAVGFDLLGLGLILTGVFADLQLEGRSFGEFIIYSGGILLFFSLLWWLGWYSFNLEVSMEDLLLKTPMSPKRSNLVQLARKLSRRISHRISQRAKRKLAMGKDGLPIGDSPSLDPRAAPIPLSPFVFVNHGLSSPMETPSLEHKQLELCTINSLCGQLEVAGVHVMVDRLI